MAISVRFLGSRIVKLLNQRIVQRTMTLAKIQGAFYFVYEVSANTEAVKCRMKYASTAVTGRILK